MSDDVARLNTGPDKADQGLAKLVLTVVELLRRVMEHEALRRIEGQTLTEEEIEQMGESFLQLDNKIAEMREVFGLRPEDLNLDLGPLGNLM
ncbi:MAG: gas vesicle protein K [Desulfitobacteriaceae bacterium]